MGFRFVKENLILADGDTPMAILLLNVMESFAEFEPAWSRERQREGIELAKRAGIYKGRRRLLTPEKAAELTRRLGEGESKASVAREFGLDRTTVYRYIGTAAAKRSVRGGQGSDTDSSESDALPMQEAQGLGPGIVCNLLHA